MSENLSHTENDVNELLQTKEFGTPLKKAREKLKLSASDVADNLLVAVEIVKAIDSSQAQALPAFTFTQGYIRNYARLVDVPVDDILNNYMQMVPDSKQPLSPHSVIPIQKTSNDALLKFISLSFILTFIIVFVYWLVDTDFTIDMIDKNNVEIVSAENGAVALSLPLIEEENESNIESDSSVKINATDSTSEIKKRPVVEQADVKQTKAVVEKKAPEQLISTDQLILSALAKSWCEVQDATGKRLYYQLLNRGDEIVLSGVAPFTVFLGNAPKVRVEINNKIVDFDSLINANSNIANLEISRDASVARLSNH